MTGTKQDIINTSKSLIEQLICDHYDELVKSMNAVHCIDVQSHQI